MRPLSKRLLWFAAIYMGSLLTYAAIVGIEKGMPRLLH
jgi:hypothetical protein